jgi:hypothetical protein
MVSKPSDIERNFEKMTQEAAEDDARAQPKGPSIWKKITDKLGLNVPIMLMMVKYVASEASSSVNQIGT